MTKVSKGIQDSKDAQKQPFGDPRGEFPTPDYFSSTSINYAATGSRRNELWTGGGVDGVSTQKKVGVSSKYYFNDVMETRSGHVVEYDDTPGAERILIKHREGGGVEWHSDGSLTVTTPKSRVQVTGEDETVIVEGEANLTYLGDLNIKVTGDFNIECGNFNVNAKGDKTENITGSSRTNIGENFGTIVGGGYSTTVTDQVTNTFLGGYSQNIKGTFSNNINGDAGMFASGNITMTSEGTFTGSSHNMTLAANDMTVMGGNGVIGGDSVHIKGQEASFEGSVEAPTFYGNLIGKAKFAALADKATGATTAGALGASGTASNPSDPGEPTFTAPTTSLVTTYLTKAAGGIRKVRIDIGNYMRNFVNKSTDTGGLSKTNVDTKVARSKLRDSANRSNSTFIANSISNGVISENYSNPSPIDIGRIVNWESPIPVSGGIGTNPASAYIPKRSAEVRLIPESQYNPYFAGLNGITGKTKVGPGITVSKFFGRDAYTNIDFITNSTDVGKKARLEIAKYYALHAQIIKTVQDNKDQFENVRLQIAEGMYKPGPQETVTAGSINDLRMKGRAVVYDLVGDDGKTARTKLFDLAVFWKDTVYFDKIILDYDTLNPDDALTARLIVILPEVDEEWNGTYRRLIETQFNGNKLSQGELVEILDFEKAEAWEGNTPIAPVLEGGKIYKASDFPTMTYSNYAERNADKLNTLDPKVRDRYAKFIKDAQRYLDTRKQGQYILIGAATRSMEEQADLYTKYKRTGKYKAAPPGSSWHNYGVAIDLLIVETRGSNQYHTGNLYVTEMRRLAIKNGLFNNAGDRSDPGHFVPFEFPTGVPKEIRSGSTSAIDYLTAQGGAMHPDNVAKAGKYAQYQ